MPVGGKLKLKGGEALPKPGGVKKRKKKPAAEGKELALAAVEDAKAAGGDANGEEAAAPKRTAEGVFLEPNPAEDRRTEAEKKLEAHFEKYEKERAKKEAAKSHREKIKELNEKLANQTEHFDLFRISYTA